MCAKYVLSGIFTLGMSRAITTHGAAKIVHTDGTVYKQLPGGTTVTEFKNSELKSVCEYHDGSRKYTFADGKTMKFKAYALGEYAAVEAYKKAMCVVRKDGGRIC